MHCPESIGIGQDFVELVCRDAQHQRNRHLPAGEWIRGRSNLTLVGTSRAGHVAVDTPPGGVSTAAAWCTGHVAQQVAQRFSFYGC